MSRVRSTKEIEDKLRVFCQDCKFFKYTMYDEAATNAYSCTKKAKKERKIIITAIHRKYSLLEYWAGLVNCHSKNCDNDCKDFKRIWWKFWVKAVNK